VVEETLARLPAAAVDGCGIAFLLDIDRKARAAAEQRVNSLVT